jgi:hypothetical protein
MSDEAPVSKGDPDRLDEVGIAAASLGPLLEEIGERGERLKERLGRFFASQTAWSADISLYGFLLGASDNADAAAHLAAQERHRFAAHPNARAAFEAGEDALLLVTSDDYRMLGARARVYERLEHADLAREIHAVHAAFGDGSWTPASYASVRASIVEDAEREEEFTKETRSRLREALDYFQPKFEAASRPKGRGRYPPHWSELSRRKIAQAIGQRRPSLISEITLVATYAHLSRHTHPRVRMENWTDVVANKDAVQFARAEHSPATAAFAAVVALRMADEAADTRERMTL